MRVTRYANPTPEQLERRAYARKYAAKARARKLAAKNAAATTCQRAEGRHGRCAGMLVDTVDRALGIVHRHCPRCERRKAGVCRDCNRPVDGARGKALRCAEHKAVAIAASLARYAEENAALVRRRARNAARKLSPEKRAKRLALKAAWRKANPDKVRLQKRREALRQSEHTRAYHKAYRAKRRAEKAEAECIRGWQRRGTVAPVVCGCGVEIPRPARGRPRSRCDACAPVSDVVRRKPLVAPAIIPPRGHACLGCGARIKRGMAKKCAPCKERTREQARDVLRAEGWAVPPATAERAA